MSVEAKRILVGNAPTRITTQTRDPLSGSLVLLKNRGAVSVFLGGSVVTVLTGYELPSGEGMTLPLDEGEILYGVVTAGTAEVHVLEHGV